MTVMTYGFHTSFLRLAAAHDQTRSMDKGALIAREYVGAELGDARLTRRFEAIGRRLADSPARSLPRSFDKAALAAVYRFLSNPGVEPDALLQPHVAATLERCALHPTVVVAHDTSVFVYAADGRRRGLGTHYTRQQFFGHVSLAVGLEGFEPLGALALLAYARDGSQVKGAEQLRWSEQVDAVAALDAVARERMVHVMDREADAYVTLAKLVEGRHRFVVRASDDRTLLPQGTDRPKLFETLNRVSAIAAREVPLSKRGKAGRSTEARKRQPAREGRLASLHFSATTIVLPRPRSAATELPEHLQLNVTRVWEPSPPDGEVGVEWLLYTTEPIATTEQILAVVDMYRARWRIEEFFKALKTGCAFEKKQLETFDALVNALALYLPLAWRTLHVRSAARHEPDAPASTILDQEELTVLRQFGRRKLPPNPTRRDVFLAIAAMGGHLKHNGEPGWQTLGGGLEDLLILVSGYRAGRASRDV